MVKNPVVKITGIGVAYPPASEGIEELEKAAHALCKPSPALDKLIAFSRSTGIKSRSLVVPYGSLARPVGGPPPILAIDQISEIFLTHGVSLAVSAARAAIQDAGISVEDITHVVSSTCTHSGNPGYDVPVCQKLGLRPTVEKVLLHGVGCAGGLAGLGLARTLCAAGIGQGWPIHVLVVACEITSPLGRWYLDCVDKKQEIPLGLAIYGDGASALVVSLDSTPPNGQPERGIFEVVGSTHLMFPGTDDQLKFNPGPYGLKEYTSPLLPQTYRSAIPVIYKRLLDTAPPGVAQSIPTSPAAFDWPVQASYFLINEVRRAMGLSRDNFKASWELYETRANTSSSSVGCALDLSRRIEKREWIISVGFGAGVAGEAVLLRRIQPQTPVRAVL